MLEITTAPFAAIDKKATQYKVPSKFPEIEIDLTFNADITSVKFDKIKKTAAMATDLLDEVVVKDIYFSEDGSCALTLRFSFVSTDRTLTKQELAPVTEAVANALVSEGLTIKE
jgi:phenylalanyl-tRNA synthetase beta chain